MRRSILKSQAVSPAAKLIVCTGMRISAVQPVEVRRAPASQIPSQLGSSLSPPGSREAESE